MPATICGDAAVERLWCTRKTAMLSPEFKLRLTGHVIDIDVPSVDLNVPDVAPRTHSGCAAMWASACGVTASGQNMT